MKKLLTIGFISTLSLFSCGRGSGDSDATTDSTYVDTTVSEIPEPQEMDTTMLDTLSVPE